MKLFGYELTLTRARAIARSAGLRHVYTGNVFDPEGEATYCAECGKLLIERDRFRIGLMNLDGGACAFCGAKLAGFFA